MSENSENKTSEIVTAVRESMRSDVNIARLKNRQNKVDGLRVAPNELKDHSINLQMFNKDDILSIVKSIKKNKHAQTTELLKLSHAFLQSTDNIQCFLNSTGAMNVLVKELTGSDSEKQILAVECLCNLSLGSEISCEKVALQAGTYLHTFLKSSNEGLLRTSLWCLTNLVEAGKKPLAVLLNQEIITGLISVNADAHNDQIRKESFSAIELIIDHIDVSTFKSSDLKKISEWIVSHSAPINVELSIIVYKFLDKLEFQSNDPICMEKLLTICFETLVQLCSQPGNTAHQIILLVRICSNITILHNKFGNYIVENWFCSSNRSISEFFNQIVHLIRSSNLNPNEIYWFINNLANTPLSSNVTSYINSDGFYANLVIVE